MMKLRHGMCVAVGLLVLAGTPAHATVIYVNAGSNAGSESGTQQNPYKRVQAAVDAAANGDEIRVAAGTYTENVRIQDKSLVLQGGYSGSWTRDISANTTTLAGAGGDSVVSLIGADVTIDGFRITGGAGSPEGLPYARHGGGIYSRDGSPTISNNIIEGNDIRSEEPASEVNFGGGVYVANAPSANILNNVIRNNFAGRGSGISANGETALIQGNTIENNTSVGDHGGGLFIIIANARITQNIIRGNEVGRAFGYGWGGGLIVANTGSFAELSFNRVYDNYAAAYGAGEFIDEGARADIHHELIYRNITKDGCEAVSAIAVDGGTGVGSEATISHCTVVNNVCSTVVRGNGLQVEGASTVSVTNSIFWGNGGDDFAVDGTSALTVTYTDSEESIAGTGNISSAPRFVNEAADDYRLANGSPCTDAGDPASPYANEPAPNGGRADLGRYGNAGEEPPPDNANNNDNSSGNDNGSGNDNSSNANDNGSNANDNSSNANDNGSGNHSGGCGSIGPAMTAVLSSLSVVGLCRMRRRVRPS
jgi:hypothetical protein